MKFLSWEKVLVVYGGGSIKQNGLYGKRGILLSYRAPSRRTQAFLPVRQADILSAFSRSGVQLRWAHRLEFCVPTEDQNRAKLSQSPWRKRLWIKAALRWA